jgi:hypothetical protein
MMESVSVHRVESGAHAGQIKHVIWALTVSGTVMQSDALTASEKRGALVTSARSVTVTSYAVLRVSVSIAVISSPARAVVVR